MTVLPQTPDVFAASKLKGLPPTWWQTLNLAARGYSGVPPQNRAEAARIGAGLRELQVQP